MYRRVRRLQGQQERGRVQMRRRVSWLACLPHGLPYRCHGQHAATSVSRDLRFGPIFIRRSILVTCAKAT